MSKKLIPIILFCISLICWAQEDEFNGILYHDIETSTLEELQLWNSELGLKPDGNEAQLKKQLKQYYKLETDLSEVSSAEGTVIEIRSAGLLDTISIEGQENQNLLLSGGIQLFLKEENGVEHLVEAEEIFIDQETKIMSAKGDVVYTKKSGSDVETFLGEGLSFSINNWEGIFFDGQTLRAQKIKDPNSDIPEQIIDFVYGGALFIKGSGNSFLLKDAVITSSDYDDPNYHITASEIIILAPGEWTLTNAVLYIGRIPFFYFPFFFYPGRELVFNPVAGYRSREGNYIMTTTYFLGEKSEEDEMFSFIQLGDLTGGNVKKERIGIYIDKSYSEESVEQDKGLLKLGIDYYTRLGGAAFVEADFSHVDWANTFKFSAGLAVSRVLFEDSTLYTSPYYQNIDGTMSQYWQESNFLGIKLPFRYFGTFSYNNAFESLSLTTNLKLYSDTEYFNDFMNREESMNFTGGGSDEEDEKTTTTTVTPQIDLSLRYSTAFKPFDNDILNLSNFSLSSAANFTKKTDAGYEANRLLMNDPDKEYNPLYVQGVLKEFFYPTSIKVLNTSFNMGGSFGDFQYPLLLSDQEANQLPFVINPETSDPSENLNDLDILNGTSIPSKPIVYTGGFTYKINPSYEINTAFDPEEWDRPEDINLEKFAMHTSKLYVTGELDYKMNMLNNFIGLTYSIDSSYTQPGLIGYGVEYNEKTIETQKLLDSTGKVFTNTQTASISLYPLNFIDELSSTNITYNFKSKLFDYKYVASLEEYIGREYKFTENETEQSSIGGNLSYKKGDFSQSITLSSTVIPMEPSVSLSSITKLPFFTINFNNRFKEDADTQELVLDSSNGSASFNIEPLEKFKITSNASFDFGALDDFKVLNWKSNASYDLFELDFILKNSTSFTYDSDRRRWTEGASDAFIPTDLDIKIRDPKINLYSWYNRIALNLTGTLDFNADLQRYNLTTLYLSYGLSFEIKEFLTLTISGKSENTSAYRYIPYFAEALNKEWLNPIDDVIDSFNFFDTTKRENSNFNLTSINIGLDHYLDDWKLSVTYTGSPKKDDVSKRYYWNQGVDITFQWNPIPELKSEIDYTDDKWTIKED